MFLASAYPAGILALPMKLRVCSKDQLARPPEQSAWGETIKVQHGSLGIKWNTKNLGAYGRKRRFDYEHDQEQEHESRPGPLIS
jgi:hypothetical protein